MKACWQFNVRIKDHERVTYRGAILDDDLNTVWYCLHKHASRDTARMCARSHAEKIMTI